MGAGNASLGTPCRCRHAVAAVGPYVFIYGGLRGSILLDDLLLADDDAGTELSVCDPRSQAWCVPLLYCPAALQGSGVAVLWWDLLQKGWTVHAAHAGAQPTGCRAM